MGSMVIRWLVALGLAMTLAGTASAQARLAETPSYKLERVDEGAVTAIVIAGSVMAPMADELAALFAEIPAERKVVIDLDCAGGDKDEGYRIVALLERERKHRPLSTLVWYNHLCASICIPIFMQGERRHAAPVSSWMFHPATRGRNPFPDTLGTADYLESLVSYGVNEAWLKMLARHDVFSTPGEYWISGAELYTENAGIITHLLPARRRFTPPEIAFDPQIQPR